MERGGMPRHEVMADPCNPQKLLDCGLLIAKSPEEGSAISKENRAEIRWVITDGVLPAVNGRRLAEQILKISPNTSRPILKDPLYLRVYQ